MRFVIGDIHGRIEALNEVLELSNFDDDKDSLIVLGDVCDGGANTKEVVDRLLNIQNLELIRGNHDDWFLEFIYTDQDLYDWKSQGGAATMKSYGSIYNISDAHIEFFAKGESYLVRNNDIFVHGGFNPYIPIKDQDEDNLMWDRTLIDFARLSSIPNYNRVFVGHTTTQVFGQTTPIKSNNLWMLDTGAGWDGRLSIMDIETEEYWCSELQKVNL